MSSEKIRGISFVIQNSRNILKEIFEEIDIKKYYWYNVEDQSEVWSKVQENEDFRRKCFNGDNFYELIQNDCYVIFLKVQMYLENVNYCNVNTYEEFLNSDCEMIVLIYDSAFVEIYTKKEDMADIFYRIAKKHNYKNVDYITDANDSRVEMNLT